MPYSNNYIMRQLARGRPVPNGQPEPHLHRALALASAMEIDTAIHMGARIDMPDGHGRSSVHILLDNALNPQGGLRIDSQRLVACLRALVRNGANFNLPHRATGMTAAARLAPFAAFGFGKEVRHLIGSRVNWEHQVASSEETVKQLWNRYETTVRASDSDIDPDMTKNSPTKPRIK